MPPSKQEFTEVELPYSIHSWSSYSADYHPKNILIDNPSEQSSRWSSEENNLLQFILLRLEQVSLIRRITFGKYFKAHICNLKEFKIYGGLAIEHMMELFHGGLNNDEKKEHFSITCKYKELEVPCKFIKIVPILAWGSNFNFSIWYCTDVCFLKFF
ncbi:muskelin-like [Zophobas morio]|uniref:muskelin-like n=1 Tax=Zophobas morio TaxID=2755281 RepID=UPI003083515E